MEQNVDTLSISFILLNEDGFVCSYRIYGYYIFLVNYSRTEYIYKSLNSI